MHEARLVHHTQRVSNRGKHRCRFSGRQCPALDNHASQGWTRKDLHDDMSIEDLSSGFDVVNSDDMVMVDPCRTALAVESRNLIWSVAVGKNLDRDLTPRLRIGGAPDATHAAAA